MSCSLSPIYSMGNSPSQYKQFFTDNEQDTIERLVTTRTILCADPLTIPPPCGVNLFFGFFFDGTNNNLKRDSPNQSQSNVARLALAYPGTLIGHGHKWSGNEFPNYFPVYIPGVGTRFDEVQDRSDPRDTSWFFSNDRVRGLAMAYKGEARIIWALVQVVNNLARYLSGRPIVNDAEFIERFLALQLYRYNTFSSSDTGMLAPREAFDQAFKNLLYRLKQQFSAQLQSSDGSKPANMDKGHVKNIYLSVFGFSRGSTMARVFVYWLGEVLKLDKAGALGNIPVTIDFVGLFDTVASVGFANSFLNIPDGHQAWADCEVSMRIPDYVKKCLHLVSAHEVRRSFPLDSVGVKGTMPAQCEEIVLPGVHSDVGGGYWPKEQGRGTDEAGKDMLSRIPLAMMYRQARLAGVPLLLEQADIITQQMFDVAPETIAAFNAYLDIFGAGKRDLLYKLMQEQHLAYIAWRRKSLNPVMESFASTMRCNVQDRTDLIEANRELEQEISKLKQETQQMQYAQSHPAYQYQSGPRGEYRAPIRYLFPEWKLIGPQWLAAPEGKSCDLIRFDTSAVHVLFENWVHDSRAWFKPFGQDINHLQTEMNALLEKEAKWPEQLTEADKQKIRKYRGSGNTEAGLEPCKEGREPLSLGGGYLRFRKIYFASDSYKPKGCLYE